MKTFFTSTALLFLWVVSIPSTGQFICVPLGTSGGLSDDNLSAYLISVEGSEGAVCLDAGTLFSGISLAYRAGSFYGLDIPEADSLSPEGWILRHYIKAYAISHAHLDHIAGLVIASVEDSQKPIYGSATTIRYLNDNIFNWQIWPNFGNEGIPFALGKYTYQILQPFKEVEIIGTGIWILSFTLSHSEPYHSTAFLLKSGEYYLLYVGDTGPDEVEKSGHLDSLWVYIAPLIRENKLNTIFLEVSYPDGIPDSRLFGHLTPSWHIDELTKLAIKVHPDDHLNALKGVKVVVTGIKPSLVNGIYTPEIIRQELNALNTLGVRFIIPEQGKKYEF